MVTKLFTEHAKTLIIIAIIIITFTSINAAKYYFDKTDQGTQHVTTINATEHFTARQRLYINSPDTPNILMHMAENEEACINHYYNHSHQAWKICFDDETQQFRIYWVQSYMYPILQAQIYYNNTNASAMAYFRGTVSALNIITRTHALKDSENTMQKLTDSTNAFTDCGQETCQLKKEYLPKELTSQNGRDLGATLFEIWKQNQEQLKTLELLEQQLENIKQANSKQP